MTCILWIAPCRAALATAAESLVYGRDREPMGPLPVMAIHKDDGIEISFIHTGGDWSAQATCLLTSWSREARYIR